PPATRPPAGAPARSPAGARRCRGGGRGVGAPAAPGPPGGSRRERAALAEGTVRNYLSSAASKLGADNRHAAVRLARERGWV
ncbi:hypothetical protein ACFWIR_05150, partial [Streptomyces olivaceus]